MKRAVSGVVLVDKPYGWSSTKALAKARWLFQAQKGGHTGVLDPLATGLLPVCLGEATKFAQRMLDADKGYLATVRLGEVRNTGDLEGEVIATRPVDVTEADIQAVLSRFRGTIQQVPPMYSALKHEGRALYDYARDGVEIARPARTVEIFELELRACRLPELELAVRCSKGTYIRTLAEDIGQALGCGACLAGLRRTLTGGFSLDQAHTLEAIEAMPPEARDALLLPVDSLLVDLPVVTLVALDATRLAHGQAVRHDGLPGQKRVYGPDGRFLGLGEQREGTLYPARMMGNP